MKQAITKKTITVIMPKGVKNLDAEKAFFESVKDRVEFKFNYDKDGFIKSVNIAPIVDVVDIEEYESNIRRK